jgi:hypothetical protein
MKTKKKEKLTRIYVNKLLAGIINSRDVMTVLEVAIQKTNTELVVLDFTNIKFISRSAAHALLLLKEKFECRSSNRKMVSFESAIYDVSEMLRIVNANKAYPKEERVEFNPKRIDISSLFKQAA